jgi:hypothetical protein
LAIFTPSLHPLPLLNSFGPLSCFFSFNPECAYEGKHITAIFFLKCNRGPNKIGQKNKKEENWLTETIALTGGSVKDN